MHPCRPHPYANIQKCLESSSFPQSSFTWPNQGFHSQVHPQASCISSPKWTHYPSTLPEVPESQRCAAEQMMLPWSLQPCFGINQLQFHHLSPSPAREFRIHLSHTNNHKLHSILSRKKSFVCYNSWLMQLHRDVTLTASYFWLICTEYWKKEEIKHEENEITKRKEERLNGDNWKKKEEGKKRNYFALDWAANSPVQYREFHYFGKDF